jgi:hypothetical protein
MNNGTLRVKTTRTTFGWSYAVVNAAGQTMVTRRGYSTDSAARAAGFAAADALAPVDPPSRYTYLPEPTEVPTKIRDQVAGWRTLFR